MKRMSGWLMAGLAVVSSMAMAQTNQVTSVNIVGYNTCTLYPGGRFHQVGIQLDQFTPTLMGVFGTNQLRGSTFSTRADQLWVWDGMKYVSYAFDTNPVVNAWCDTTHWGTPTNPVLDQGSAFFILTPKSGPYATQTNTIRIMGEVVLVDTQMITMVTNRYAMMCYPFSSDIRIDQLNFANCGAYSNGFSSRADQLWIWDSSQKLYLSFALKNTTPPRWYQISPLNLFSSGPAASNVISLGQAFWYVRSTYAPKITWTWTEVNPYKSNL